MEVFRYIFELGVVFIVFNIIWFLISYAPRMILNSANNNISIEYILKVVQYFLLSSLTAITSSSFIVKNNINSNFAPWYFVIGGFVLFLYLIGKYEKKKLFKMAFKVNKEVVNKKDTLIYEPHIIGFALIFFASSLKYTFLIDNIFNSWLIENIYNFYQTPIIGWFIGLAGVIFLFTIITKGVNTIKKILFNIQSFITGKPIQEQNSNNFFERLNNMSTQINDDADFENLNDEGYIDFEEVDDDILKEEKDKE